MSDPASTIEDNSTTPDEDNVVDPDDTGEQATEKAKADSFLLNFKTKEDAEKAFKEEQRKITEQGTRLSQLQQEMESIRQQNQLASAISELAKKGEEKKPALDFDRFVNEVAEDYSNDPKQAVRKQMAALSSWMEEERKKGTSETMSALKAEMAALKAELSDTLERKDTVYEQHKEIIDELVAGGMKFASAKKFVREKLVKDEQTQKDAPPPSLSTGRVSSSQKRTDDYFVSKEEEERYKAKHGLTDDQIAYLKLERQREIQRANEIKKRKESI